MTTLQRLRVRKAEISRRLAELAGQDEGLSDSDRDELRKLTTETADLDAKMSAAELVEEDDETRHEKRRRVMRATGWTSCALAPTWAAIWLRRCEGEPCRERSGSCWTSYAWTTDRSRSRYGTGLRRSGRSRRRRPLSA